jgi:hypothetical protein
MSPDRCNHHQEQRTAAIELHRSIPSQCKGAAETPNSHLSQILPRCSTSPTAPHRQSEHRTCSHDKKARVESQYESPCVAGVPSSKPRCPRTAGSKPCHVPGSPTWNLEPGTWNLGSYPRNCGWNSAMAASRALITSSVIFFSLARSSRTSGFWSFMKVTNCCSQSFTFLRSTLSRPPALPA